MNGQSCNCNKEKHHTTKQRILNIFRLIFGLILVILSYSLNAFLYPNLNENQKIIFNAIIISLIVICYLFLTYDLFIKAFKNIKKKKIFTDVTLTLIATIAALAIKAFEEAILIIFFYQIGEILEHYATNKSQKEVEKLINSTKLVCHLKQKKTFIDIDPKNIKIGDVIEIRPNEKIPVDGVIIDGESYLDLSILNGESLPVFVYKDSKVLSGSMNKDNNFLMKVTKTFDESTLTKIIELVKNEESKKSNSEKFISKFAKYYTPCVLVLAILYFFIPFAVHQFVFDNQALNYIKGSINILLTSCPCSLVISVPLTFFISIGKLSKIGVLVKGSYNIETLNKCDVFAFDKTGTLTKGEFEITNNVQEKFLIISASLEQKFTHPIATSIKKMVDETKLLEPSIVTNFPGKGIEGTINNITYRLGEKSFTSFEEITIPQVEQTGKVIYLTDITNKEFLCYFVIEDTIKESSYQAINALNNKKIHTVMLSGDKQSIANEIGDELKISEVYGELMPEDKLDKISNLQKEKHKVCYIGDGVNDSPSLLRADVGISMGKLGSDVAKESAPIVILNDNLNTIIKAKTFSKKTMFIVYENIIFILLVKLTVMILTLPIFPFQAQEYWMIVSVCSDVGLLILSILNSARLFLKKYY